MGFGWALLYGFIQGVTEFLPVSSSGHLALIPYFFELKDPGVLFDLLMHLGTALAVILYFNKEVKTLILEFKNLLFTRNFKESVFVQNFLLSTVASFILIMAIKDISFSYGRAANIIGFNFIFFGILMFLADRKVGRDIDLTKKKNLKLSILIGLSQSLAVFPGVSRSGITLTSSRYLGMGRVQASRFSFLLSLPVIIGGIIFKIPEILNGSIQSVDYSVMAFGIFFSFLFGIVTIHIFLKLIAKIGLVYFSLYRIVIGALLIYLSYS
jgi:undecaprenyl-diphosphatase